MVRQGAEATWARRSGIKVLVPVGQLPTFNSAYEQYLQDDAADKLLTSADGRSTEVHIQVH